jgi:hypothetical protein
MHPHVLDVHTYATHAWALTDEKGTALCTFVAPSTDAEGDLTGPCR